MQSKLIAKAELDYATIYLHSGNGDYSVTRLPHSQPSDRISNLALDDALGSFSELVRREEEV